MEIRSLKDDHLASWDDFCDQNADAWFWQKSTWLKFLQIVRPKSSAKALDFSIWRDGKMIALCPLAVETISYAGKDMSVFSRAADLIPAPVFRSDLQPNDRQRVTRAVFAEIDRLANLHGVMKAGFRCSVLTPRILQPSLVPENEFIRYGYLDASILTQVLDLGLTEAALWSDFRKSYHSLIRRAETGLQLRILDSQNVTQVHFDSYRTLYNKAAGGSTRPAEAFQMMQEWVRHGDAFLAQALLDGNVCGSAYVLVYKNKAYYTSACNDPELEKEWAIGHFLQWKLIQDLKRRQITHYELGWQFYGPQMAYIPSPEEIQIAFFKRGFGGYSIPLQRGEKYYSREFFLSEYSKRVEQCAMALPDALPNPVRASLA